MKSYSLIRTIYLYTFALLGLILLIIGGVNFLNMGLKAFIFTKADEESRIMSKQMSVPFPVSKIENMQQDILEGDNVCLSEEEKAVMESWLVDYNNWNESMKSIDPIVARRHRDASINLSLILIGLPLYIFHWRIIKKETEQKEEINEDKD